MFNYFKSKFKQCTDPLKVVDSKNVRRVMIAYFHDTDSILWQSITKVECFENSKGLIIQIETHRPGLLIGKGGEFIDGIEKWIKIQLDRTDIKIDLRESKLWSNLYK